MTLRDSIADRPVPPGRAPQWAVFVPELSVHEIDTAMATASDNHLTATTLNSAPDGADHQQAMRLHDSAAATCGVGPIQIQAGWWVVPDSYLPHRAAVANTELHRHRRIPAGSLQMMPAPFGMPMQPRVSLSGRVS